MRAVKHECRGAHRLPSGRVSEQRGDGRDEGVGVRDLDGGAGRLRLFRCFGEIEHMRTHERRPSRADRLDQVLPAERQEAAADEGDVGGSVVARHLAHRVTKHDFDVGRHGSIAAAKHERDPASAKQFGHLREALRMTRDDHRQRARRKRACRECVEKKRLLAVPGRCSDPYGTRLAEARPELPSQRLAGVRRDRVEFQIPGDDGGRRTECRKSCRIDIGLGRDAGQCTEHRSRERGKGGVEPRGSRRHSRIDEVDRHAGLVRERDEIGPQFGFHEKPDARIEMREESPYGERRVVRQPCLQHAVAEERAPGFAAGRRHVRQQHGRIWMRAAQPQDEWRRGAGFAERDGVHPDDPWRCRAPVSAVTLADVLAIAGFAAAAPHEAQRRERQRRAPQQRIEAAQRIHQQRGAWRINSEAARRTSSGVGGVPMPPRSRAHGPAGPTPQRSGSVATNSETVGVPSAAAR